MSPPEEDCLVDAAGLRVSYGSPDAPVDAVRGISFRMRRGLRYGIVGQSGSGKSSVSRALLGLVRPPHRVTADTLRVGGRDVLSMTHRELRRMRGPSVGYVGQNPFGSLHPVLSVGEQCHQFLRAHGQSRRKAESLKRAVAALDAVGIPDPERVLRGHAGQLSGGMAQRTVIAISTMLEPELLIADEPTTALDVTVQRQVLDLIAAPELGAERSLLLVTHDLAVVAQYCDEVIVMRHGEIMESGPVATVFRRPGHEYTAALLAAVPQTHSGTRRSPDGPEPDGPGYALVAEG